MINVDFVATTSVARSSVTRGKKSMYKVGFYAGYSLFCSCSVLSCKKVDGFHLASLKRFDCFLMFSISTRSQSFDKQLYLS